MDFLPLTNISPVDGRYKNQTKELNQYFSEYAIIHYRVLIEIEYFIALCNIPLPQLEDIDANLFEDLRNIYRSFTTSDAVKVKEIELETNHDVKAVEYFLKNRFEKLGISDYKEFIHFGLTSQDINNTVIPYKLKEAFNDILFPMIEKIFHKLVELSNEWREIAMISYTHGQPATPTKLGKEIYVFAERMKNQMDHFEHIPFSAKFGGASGNFNAHYAAYPKINWIEFADYFVNKLLNLDRLKNTTQIEHYDNLAAFFDNFKRINTILIDLCRDTWTYISMNYFNQKITEGEVGSSTMPHKVNPIDFENAEGNLGIANAIFQHLSAKLPISRLQRDLTDSTVTRNIGVPIAHSLIAMKSILKGLEKLILNEAVIEKDLKRNWVIVSEAIQTILRREGYINSYEALKELTRTNEKIDKTTITEFIESLEVPEPIKTELKRITPFNYLGVYDF
ncbi:adenylosuccinate lyase [candidate division KSB1 bacterium]